MQKKNPEADFGFTFERIGLTQNLTETEKNLFDNFVPIEFAFREKPETSPQSENVTVEHYRFGYLGFSSPDLFLPP